MTTDRETHPREDARVYMANMGYHDYTPAEKWGEFIPVTQGRVDLVHTDRMEAEIQRVLREFTDKDYLLLGGAPIVIAFCIGYLFRKFGYVDILYWDAMYGDYRYRKLSFDEKNKKYEPVMRRVEG